MITVDVIMPALGSTEQFRKMTGQTLLTLENSETDIYFNPVVVESYKSFFKEGHKYDAKIVIPQEAFNYNLYLQIGLKYASGADWTVLCNNDLIFQKNWFSKILSVNKRFPEIKSFSPWDEGTHPAKFINNNKILYVGKRSSYELAGWCIAVKRELLNKIYLDPRVSFWYSENVYADELKRLNEKHCLVRESEVYHLKSKTLNSMDKKTQREITINQFNKYKN